MRTTTLACLFFLGIGSSVHGQGEMVEYRVEHDERRRAYRLYVPSTYQPDTPTPLMFLLHGLDQPFWHFEGQTRMNEVADEHGFLLAYPDALGRDWLRGDDNIGFITDAALNDISTNYSVDPARVYSAGMSQGGNMSYRLAEARPDLFAAIASVTGLSTLLPEEPIPTMQIHGTADHLVPYSSVTQMIEQMATINGCDSSSRSAVPDINPREGSMAEIETFAGCSNYVDAAGEVRSNELIFYHVDGMSHAWPGDGAPFYSPGNFDFSASETIWQFFDNHRLAVDTPPVLEGDFNQDAIVDVLDIDLLAAATRNTELDSQYDLTNDGQVNADDIFYWVDEIKNTWVGDANLDGQFDSADMVDVFGAGQYEDDILANSTWSTGDWNGDAEFDSSDLIFAFKHGGYEVGEKGAVAAVPEPSSSLSAVIAIFALTLFRFRQR